MLPNGELPRNRDHVLVDVQGRPHKMMLAHHRISEHPGCGPAGRDWDRLTPQQQRRRRNEGRAQHQELEIVPENDIVPSMSL
jgi:hypothetical protein